MKRLFLLLVVACALSGCEQIQQLYNEVKTGAPCTTHLTCLEGTCLTESEGFTGGMCSRKNCEQSGCWSLFTDCFKASLANEETTLCLPTCSNGRTCERAEEGYGCRILEESFVCVPPNAVRTQVPGVTGATCNVDAECNGTNPICMSDFKNGYCSQEHCTIGGDDCLNQNPCVSTNPKDPKARTICLKGCTKNEDCRFGYTCSDYNGTQACLPSKSVGAQNPDGTADGTACVANLNCKGGTCIKENGGERPEEGTTDVPYPGGYCTTRDCSSNLDCNGNSICVARGRNTACFARCNSNSDCRSGYECTETPEGKICDSSIKLPDVKVDDTGAIQIVCQSDSNLKFTIPSGAVGFYIAPFTKNGRRVEPTKLTFPDKSSLNIKTDYSFMAINPDLLGSLAPILFPATDEPSLFGKFGGGEYTLQTNSNSDEICYYVLPKMKEGRSLQVKVHLVGVTGLSASSAANDADVKALVQTMKSIYSKMKIDVSISEYVDVPSSISSKYKIIRNFNDIFSLVATTKDNGPTLNDNLVVNVFLIQDFAISEAPGLLGVSTGIPGVAGLNGNIGSGLVFTSASLGSNNKQLGQTMAHEIGHFLALRHTTEHKGSAHDPITDTPECKTPELQYACPDAKNFMFAFSMGTDQTEASQGQGKVMRRSPLVK